MPGYLTNRYISLNPAADVAAVESDLDSLETRVTEAEANIDDLSLNIGV
jgi:cell division protein FtsB